MPSPDRRGRPTVDEYERGVLAGDRTILGRAITLVESNLPQHREEAQQLLRRLLPHTGKAYRVGITGSPGVGKSTFIEVLGSELTREGHRVAVLAIDPTSSVSRGSILGDKTRMEALAKDPKAFIRPSPSGGSLGGVARKTRESLLVCEAAGFDVILVETVGVGQSETLVAEMVDCFVLLLLAGAGDELQGIKRGIIELADLIAVTKADGDNAQRAQQAKVQSAAALRLVPPLSAHWKPRVVTVSAAEKKGIQALWSLIEEHRSCLCSVGELTEKRRRQLLRWMWSMVEEGVMGDLRSHAELAEQLPSLEQRVLAGEATPTWAAERILEIFGARP
ncbi:MAG: methylmalonyl Co-A mutase-associated GTPase MeaB [Deltaproteobacteria bacterium]|nr:methylmalonyl Co-A mutase-associated GTPase MeaB [Deltaproteobacteria bacterium]